MTNYANNIPITAIIDRILRNPLLSNLSEDEALDYTVDFIGLLGSSKLLKKDVKQFTVSKYRTAIPPHLISIDSIRLVNYNATDIQSGVDTPREDKDSLSFINDLSNDTVLPSRLPMRPNTYTFSAGANNEGELEKQILNDFTYDIRGNFIYTSEENCTIEVAFNSLMTNESGELMIPSETNTVKALENYIAWQHLLILWGLGKIPDKVVSKYEQEYDWYMAKAQNAAIALNLDERDSLSNQITQMFTGSYDTYEYFKNQTSKGYRRSY